jgi:hypothetical protein
MGQLTVSTPAVSQRVHAWIIWEDGVEELVQAHAIAWTKRAVRVRFGAPPHQDEVWVWAGAVEQAWTATLWTLVSGVLVRSRPPLPLGPQNTLCMAERWVVTVFWSATTIGRSIYSGS